MDFNEGNAAPDAPQAGEPAEVGPEALAALQEERFPIAAERAEAKIKLVRPDNKKTMGLLSAAARANTPRQRARWMHQAASAWAAPMEAVAACRRGCSHCCHIPVAILSSEAKLLASVSGSRYSMPDANTCVKLSDVLDSGSQISRPFAAHYDGVPCPFLEGGRCSVYSDRPLVCRTQINMDDDDLLCRIVPGKPASVPYANNITIQAACVSVMPEEDVFADIRDFFPLDHGK